MNKIDNLFFELLQVAIGNRDRLSQTPSVDEWREIYGVCKKQTLQGICLVGLQRLPSDQWPDRKLKLQWSGIANKIMMKNEVANQECSELADFLRRKGMNCCVIKGQSNLELYTDELKHYRTPGDIDILLRPDKDNLSVHEGIKQSILWCKKLSDRHHFSTHITYHHADIPWKGMLEVEAHYRATFLCSPMRNKRLQDWLEHNEQWTKNRLHITSNGKECEFPVPELSFNVIYQLLHIYKHLFESGIGLRQILDYYMVLRAWSGKKDGTDVMSLIHDFGMDKFVPAVMFIMKEVFLMPDDYLLCQPDKTEGQYLLNEIMRAGNFGHYDDRLDGDKGLGTTDHAIRKTRRNMSMILHYPEEVMWEPLFRIYHWMWRTMKLWK